MYLFKYDVSHGLLDVFKGKSHVSIINPQSWYFEKKEIEALFSRIEKIRNQIDYR